MVLTYENLLRLPDFTLRANQKVKKLNTHAFLSFQDALHYLIKRYQWQGKKILLPAFYCEATIHDMEAHGLKVELCKLDHQRFDVDLVDFKNTLQTQKPDIILIYNFFGKNSLLYQDKSWQQFLRDETIIISDFAHCLLPNHEFVFYTANHFYIDSTRKTTCRMMAHLVSEQPLALQNNLVKKASIFRFYIRFLFFCKSWCLRIATCLQSTFFANVGMRLYLLHDKYIGSPKDAHAGFLWDKLLYRHINFDKINLHRLKLYQAYQKEFASLTTAGIVELFPLNFSEQKNICFYFLRIKQDVPRFLEYMQSRGFWVDVLWDFDAIATISAADKEWAKSIVVFPYTVHTKLEHVEQMAKLANQFFTGSSHE